MALSKTPERWRGADIGPERDERLLVPDVTGVDFQGHKWGDQLGRSAGGLAFSDYWRLSCGKRQVCTH